MSGICERLGVKFPGPTRQPDLPRTRRRRLQQDADPTRDLVQSRHGKPSAIAALQRSSPSRAGRRTPFGQAMPNLRPPCLRTCAAVAHNLPNVVDGGFADNHSILQRQWFRVHSNGQRQDSGPWTRIRHDGRALNADWRTTKAEQSMNECKPPPRAEDEGSKPTGCVIVCFPILLWPA